MLVGILLLLTYALERNLISLGSNKDEIWFLWIKAASMREKFEIFWDGLSNMNGLVFAASVFDPRRKMQFVSFCFDPIYGKEAA